MDLAILVSNPNHLKNHIGEHLIACPMCVEFHLFQIQIPSDWWYTIRKSKRPFCQSHYGFNSPLQFLETSGIQGDWVRK